MLSNIKKSLTAFAVLAITSISGQLIATPAYAQCTDGSPTDSKTAIQGGVDCVSGSTGGDAGGSITDTVANVINILSIVAGAAAVIMLMVGGFRYITSGGSQEAAASARRTILYAVIGLVIVAVSQVIVHFVLNAASTPPANNGGSNQSQGNPPCQQLPNGGCRPGTGP